MRASALADSSRKVRTLRQHFAPSGRRRRRWTLAAVVAALGLTLSGCAGSLSSGYLPQGEGGEVTSETGRVTTLWVGTWIAAIIVALLVWGLLIWCIIAYRRKKDETGLPPQLRYNIPIEILYTVVPIFMVAVLFAYTARDEAVLMDTSATPDVTIQIVAKQWAWDFNYVDSGVYQTSGQVELTDAAGEPLASVKQTVLYLPVGKRVEFVLNARDVIHSFWVPAFLEKRDMIPGKTNKMHITPTLEGEYQGKCAELCGAYHSRMLFRVKVVPQAEYDAQMATLRARGQTGSLDTGLSREPLLPADGKAVPTPSGS